MVLIIVFAPSGRPTPYCKGPAHLAIDSFSAAMTDLSASLRRKGHHEKWSLPTRGFGEWRDLSGLEVLQHRVWN